MKPLYKRIAAFLYLCFMSTLITNHQKHCETLNQRRKMLYQALAKYPNTAYISQEIAITEMQLEAGIKFIKP